MDIPHNYKLIKNIYKILKKKGDSVLELEDNNELSLLPSYIKKCDTGDIYTNKTKINSYIEQPKIFYVNQEIVDYMEFPDKEKIEQFKKRFGSFDNMRFDNYVNDMNFIFMGVFNENISNLNVNNVESMISLFRSNKTFNQDISKWKVGNVKNMRRMFKNTTFNRDISSWDVRKVENLSEVFRNSKFNQDISKWEVEKVTSMSFTFADSSFNKDISGWNVENVTTMSNMFKNSPFNQDISGWDVRKVVNFTDMFKGSPMEGNKPEEYFNMLKDKGSRVSTKKKITQNDIFTILNDRSIFDDQLSKLEKKFGKIEDWKFDDDVYDFYSLFMGSVFNDDISDWNVENVTSMSHMFEGNTFFNQDISNWKVGNVTNMNSMFESTNFNQDIRKWDVRNVVNMRFMFKDSSFKQDISGWDVRKVVNFTDMFKGSPMEGIVPKEYFTVLKDTRR
jgi:surface protein